MAQPGVVAPWRATYVPGDWYVIAGPTSLVLLEPGPGRGDMVIDLWADVVASSSMSDLIDRLAGYGLTELPDLAVIFWSTAGMRTLVRGRVSLVDPDTGAAVVTGDDVITWNEVGLGDRTHVAVRIAAAAQGEELPVAVGVVRAGALELNAAEDAEVRSPQPLLRRAPLRPTLTTESAATVGPAAAAAVAEPSGATMPEQPTGEAPGQATEPAPAPAPAADSQATSVEARAGQDQAEPARPQPAPSDAAAETADASTEHSATESGAPEPGATARPDQAASGGAPDDDTGPDFPPIEDDTDADPASAGYLDSAWGPQPSGDAGAAGPGFGPGAAGAAGAALGAAAGSASAASGSAAGGFVGGVIGRGPDGWAGSGGSPTEFSTAQFEMENDDTQLFDGPITAGPQGQQAGPRPSAPTEPLIEGVRCPNGHANAPGSAFCRVCRNPIQPGPPQLMPQPLLARLRAADGTVVDLDRPVLFGRAPSEQRGTAPLPRLVTLASPAQDISRTHLQVVPDDWQVVVTDLHSTNGTFVTDPGPSGNKGMLPPGQPIPVPIGATLELGEGVVITVEPGD